MQTQYGHPTAGYQEAMRYVQDTLGIHPVEAERNLSGLGGIVIKLGGDCLNGDKPENLRMTQEIAILTQLGVYPIVVHGGGAQIDLKMKQAGIPIVKIDGLRVTDLETLEKCVLPSLAEVNWWLLKNISDYGGTAHSMMLQEMIYAEQLDPRLGYVGRPTGANLGPFEEKIAEGYSPLLWCIGYDAQHQALNINADHIPPVLVAAGLADRVVTVTGIGGVRRKDQTIISTIPHSQVEDYIADGTVIDGMVPKLRSHASIFKQGELPPNFKVQIIGPDNLLLELLTDAGAGTQITMG